MSPGLPLRERTWGRDWREYLRKNDFEGKNLGLIFIYLFERERTRARGEGIEGEADSPLSREPNADACADAGLNPGTPGS